MRGNHRVFVASAYDDWLLGLCDGKGGVEQARPLLIRSLDCKYQSTKVRFARGRSSVTHPPCDTLSPQAFNILQQVWKLELDRMGTSSIAASALHAEIGDTLARIGHTATAAAPATATLPCRSCARPVKKSTLALAVAASAHARVRMP